MLKTSLTHYPPPYQKYIDNVPNDQDLLTAFTFQQKGIHQFLESISEEKSLYAYAPGKWTLREALQHMIDTERIFSYRALCFARNEKTPLPGFDENEYAANANANERTWKDLSNEFLIVRQSTKLMYQNFNEEMLTRIGTTNNNLATAGSIGFTILGHVYHHIKITAERYF